MQSSLQRILLGLLIFLITCSASVGGYMLAGWDWLSAVYQVVITVFGVGFGEVRPIDTPALKIFTMAVIIFGCSSVVYIVGGFIQMLTEGEIHRAMGDRRQSLELSKLANHVIICGYGRLGQPLAQHLLQAKTPFVVVDSSAERVARARDDGFYAIQGNASDEKTLLEAGIERAKILATVLPDDAMNVFITLTARSLNSKTEIIARGEQQTTEQKLRAAGATRVVLPADIGALRIAQLITHPTAEQFLEANESRHSLNTQLEQIDLKIDEFPIPAHSSLDGKNLNEVETIGQGAFLIVGIKQADGTMVHNVEKSHVIRAGDRLIILGHRQDIPAFAARHLSTAVVNYRGVTSVIQVK
jgi:voltage-gated potassium channel